MLARDVSLDYMRFFGILIIMVAHAEPPEWLFQLRNFGTPLLIVSSAATFAVIYRQRSLNALNFLKKRLSKLIFPAWAFLTFFFAFWGFVAWAMGKSYPFDQREMLDSYTFYKGIGFVWVFKIYIMLALLTPLAFQFHNRIRSNWVYFTLLLIIYALYEMLLEFLTPYIPASKETFASRVIFVIIPYALLYLYGLKLVELSNRQIAAVCAASLAVFTGMAGYLMLKNGYFIHTQNFKYPPSLYYLSYAFFALNCVYLICRNVLAQFYSPSIIWLSSNALWIYLWHIFAFFVWKFTLGSAEGSFLLFVAKAVFLLGFGIAATYIQLRATEWLAVKQRLILADQA